jgi:hypothetical protein
MSDEVLNAIAQLSSQVGEVRGIVSGIDSKLTAHITDDRSVEARVRGLEDVRTRQKGAIGVWGLIATGAGTLAGIVTTWFKVRGHH